MGAKEGFGGEGGKEVWKRRSEKVHAEMVVIRRWRNAG
jgi:hypothetical protein